MIRLSPDVMIHHQAQPLNHRVKHERNIVLPRWTGCEESEAIKGRQSVGDVVVLAFLILLAW